MAKRLAFLYLNWLNLGCAADSIVSGFTFGAALQAVGKSRLLRHSHVKRPPSTSQVVAFSPQWQPNCFRRYEIIVTDILKFAVVYGIIYVAFYFALVTINRSYLQYYIAESMKPHNLIESNECDSVVESLVNPTYRLFTLTFSDSMWEALMTGSTGFENSCGALEVGLLSPFVKQTFIASSRAKTEYICGFTARFFDQLGTNCMGYNYKSPYGMPNTHWWSRTIGKC